MSDPIEKENIIVIPNLEKRLEEAVHDAIIYFEKKCPYCEKNLFDGHIRSKFEIDHFIPITLGGQNLPWNILPVCQSCNRKKKNKKAEDFLKPKTYEVCQEYLSLVKKKSVGNIQNIIECFKQIETLINNSDLKNINQKEALNLIYKIDKLLNPNNQTFEEIGNDNEEEYVLLKKHFIPPSYKRSAQMYLSNQEIKEFIEKKENIEINGKKLGEALKEQGFQKWQRTKNSITKWIYSLNSNL